MTKRQRPERGSAPAGMATRGRGEAAGARPGVAVDVAALVGVGASTGVAVSGVVLGSAVGVGVECAERLHPAAKRPPASAPNPPAVRRRKPLRVGFFIARVLAFSSEVHLDQFDVLRAIGPQT